MGYWGSHRRSKDSRELRNAQPQSTDSPGTSGTSGTSGRDKHRLLRRRAQPRDALGRFRKEGRDDEFAGRAVDGQAEQGVPAPRPTWRDFELDNELPRVPAREPRDQGAPEDGPADGRRHCGPLEAILFRQWSADVVPPSADVVRAIDSLAELPERLKRILAERIDGIYVGPGGVPALDDMGHLKGRELPSGVATWDICAGAYGDRKIVVGDRPSPTPDVMMHEVGHALDDIDGEPGTWQSDSPEFQALYAQCRPHLVGDFHRQPAALGRREFFADAFAAIAARQRPALVDMLGGDTRTALNVMLFFNRKYEI